MDRISCVVSSMSRGLISPIPKPRRESVGKGATHFDVGRRQPAAAVRQPNASGLANTDDNPESRCRIERPCRNAAKHWKELKQFPEAISEGPPHERAAAYGAAELCEGAMCPRNFVPGRQRAQRKHEDAGETTHADERDWNSSCASGGSAIAIDQGSGLRPYQVALGISPREVEGLERSWAGLFEGVPKQLDAIVMRRKSVF
jgi:hypothetical protein